MREENDRTCPKGLVPSSSRGLLQVQTTTVTVIRRWCAQSSGRTTKVPGGGKWREGGAGEGCDGADACRRPRFEVPSITSSGFLVNTKRLQLATICR